MYKHRVAWCILYLLVIWLEEWEIFSYIVWPYFFFLFLSTNTQGDLSLVPSDESCVFNNLIRELGKIVVTSAQCCWLAIKMYLVKIQLWINTWYHIVTPKAFLTTNPTIIASSLWDCYVVEWYIIWHTLHCVYNTYCQTHFKTGMHISNAAQ